MSFYNFSTTTTDLLTNIQEKRVKKTDSWMVSLADLLTLLLCFILSLVSYGHIRPIGEGTENIKKSEQIEITDKNEDVPKKRHPFGLKVASNSLWAEQYGENSIFFFDTDFTDSDELLGAALENLHLFLSENAERSLLIRSCAETDSWFGALRQAVALRKALLAKQFPRSQLEIELLGSECSTIRMDDNSKAVVKVEIRA